MSWWSIEEIIDDARNALLVKHIPSMEQFETESERINPSINYLATSIHDRFFLSRIHTVIIKSKRKYTKGLVWSDIIRILDLCDACCVKFLFFRGFLHINNYTRLLPTLSKLRHITDLELGRIRNTFANDHILTPLHQIKEGKDVCELLGALKKTSVDYLTITLYHEYNHRVSKPIRQALMKQHFKRVSVKRHLHDMGYSFTHRNYSLVRPYKYKLHISKIKAALFILRRARALLHGIDDPEGKFVDLCSVHASIINMDRSSAFIKTQRKRKRKFSEVGFNVRIKQLGDNDYIHLQGIKYDDKISKLKEGIRDITCMPVQQQRLVFLGYAMANERRVGSYNVVDGSIIHLVIGLQGD